MQNQRFADDPVWNLSSYIFFGKKIASDFLEECLNEIARLNDALRLQPVFTADGALLEVVPFTRRTFEKHRFETEEAFLRWAKQAADRSVFHRPGMWDAFIIELEEKSGVLNVGHHAMSDGLNVAVLYDQLLQCVNGETPQAYSYLPHLEEEARYRASKRYEKDRRFWEARLRGDFIAGFFHLPEHTADRGCVNRSYTVDAAAAKAAWAFCEEHRLSESALIYGAAALTLHYLRQVDRFSMGIPVLGRTTQAEMRALGLFMHIVPLIVDVGDTDLITFLRGVEEQVFDLFRHQSFTVYDIRSEIRDLPVYGMLYDVIVDYTVYEPHPAYESRVVYNDFIEGAMELHFLREGDALKYTLRCRTAVAEDPAAARFHSLFSAVLSAILRSPDTKIADAALLPAEKRKAELPVPGAAAPEDAENVYGLFLRQAETHPNAPAVKAADRNLSYGEAEAEAGSIAAALQKAGVGPGDTAAVCLPRDSRLICAILGILKAGAAYLPLDPQQPPGRRDLFIKDSGARLCITEENYGAFLKEKPMRQCVLPDANGVCYCIYTSGSTGAPKGVLIRHKNLIAYLHALQTIYGAGQANMPLFTSVGVDLTVTSLFLPLVTGGCVYAYSGELTESLPQIVGNPDLNILKLTPTHMRIMCAVCPKKELGGMRHIIAGGETLYGRDAAAFLAHFGRRLKIHNEYGPTETTVGCMDYIYDPARDAEITPIGKPMPDMRVYVADRYLRPVPPGVTGEICVAGAGVGAGYLNRPGLTEEKFVPDPFGGGLMYKTGDLAYIREDGNLVFTGRNDLQIKLNGHRVEPGEIESALCAAGGVESAAAVICEQGERQILCAFYTGREIPARELRAFLGRTLPQYMIPQRFTHLEAMPLTPSGKTDRAALANTGLSAEAQTEDLPPATPEQHALAEAVARTLGLEKVYMADNYYALGGDSIRAIHIVSALLGKGYELAVSDIMQCAVLGDIAAKMRPVSCGNAADEPGEESFPLTPAQEGIWLQTVRAPEDPAYRLRFLLEVTQPIDTVVLRRSFALLAMRHPALCCAFPAEDAAGELLQTARPGRTVPLQETVYPFAKDGALLQARLAEAKAAPFDLAADVLLRAEYIIFTDARYLLISAHHIILDGWSLPLLARDLFRFAARLTSGEPFEALAEKTAAEPAARSVFKRYALMLAKMDKTQAYSHWEGLLSGCVPARITPYPGAGEGCDAERAYEYADIPADVAANAARLGRTLGVSQNTLLEGAFALALARFSGGEDILFCKPVSGRSLPVAGIEQGVGPFLNTVPARYVLRDPGQSVKAFLLDAHAQSVRANRFCVLRLGEALRCGNIPRGAVQALFAFENYYFENKDDPGLSALPFTLVAAEEQTEFPLAVTLRQTGARLNCRITYAPQCFSPADAARLKDIYLHTLWVIAASAEALQTPVAHLIAPGAAGAQPSARHRAFLPVTPLAADAYAPPAAAAEKALAAAAANVLRLPRVGMDDNYFALGGDSIRAIYLASELRSAGWNLRIADIMRAGTVRELAKKMTPVSGQSAAPAPYENDRAPLPPAARAYLNAAPAAPERFWQSCIIPAKGTGREIEAALAELTRRHPMLRAVLRDNALCVLPEDAALPRFRTAAVTEEEGGIAEARRRLSALDISFDLSKGPLADAALYTAPEGSLLRLTVHHLAVDLFSWEILLRDLEARLADPAAALPQPTAPFSQWMAALEAYKTAMPAQDAAFWAQRRAEAERAAPLFSQTDPLLPGEAAEIAVDAGLTDALLRIEEKENVRMDALLLAALGRGAARIAGGHVCVCVESLGRPQLTPPVRVDGTVGWFTAIYPVAIGDENDVTQLLFGVRRKLLQTPQSGVGWLLLNKALPENAGLMFNFYRNGGDAAMRAEPVFPTGERAFDMLFPGVINVDCVLSDGDLSVRFRCPALRRRPGVVRGLADQLILTLREIAALADFTGRRADSADAYTDDTLTYGELSALDAIFNGVDDDEQN